MPITVKSIMPCLWFDTEAEAAAKHYVSIFENSKIGSISRYGKEGKEIHGKQAGHGDDRRIRARRAASSLALNGGPQFKFDEAVSFQVLCETPGRGRLLLEQAVRRRLGRARAAG